MGRIDPQPVIISMRRAYETEAVAAIGRAINGGVQHVNRIHIFGIGENVMEIPGALRITVITGEELPGIASVIAAIDAAFFRLDDGVNAIAVGARNGHADAAEDAGRKAVTFKTLPSSAIVDGLIETAARAAADGGPRVALRFVE